MVKGARLGFLDILMDLCLALSKVKINGLGLICMFWVGVLDLFGFDLYVSALFWVGVLDF